MSEQRFWIAVACAEHVRLGRARGFMQVCHGKRGPLARVQPGDGVAYYSPAVRFRGADPLRSFTALGNVRPGEPYQVDMGAGFRPFRRDVDWAPIRETPIAPLLDELEFSRGRRNWGYQLRFGLFAICGRDFESIGRAMCEPAQPGLGLLAPMAVDASDPR